MIALAIEGELRRYVQAAVSRVAQGVRLILGTADPVNVLAAVGGQVHADAIVVGASTSLGHRIAGSVAVRLVRSRRWPVTVVP